MTFAPGLRTDLGAIGRACRSRDALLSGRRGAIRRNSRARRGARPCRRAGDLDGQGTARDVRLRFPLLPRRLGATTDAGLPVAPGGGTAARNAIPRWRASMLRCAPTHADSRSAPSTMRRATRSTHRLTSAARDRSGRRSRRMCSGSPTTCVRAVGAGTRGSSPRIRAGSLAHRDGRPARRWRPWHHRTIRSLAQISEHLTARTRWCTQSVEACCGSPSTCSIPTTMLSGFWPGAGGRPARST